jgi:hypothetical protein
VWGAGFFVTGGAATAGGEERGRAETGAARPAAAAEAGAARFFAGASPAVTGGSFPFLACSFAVGPGSTPTFTGFGRALDAAGFAGAFFAAGGGGPSPLGGVWAAATAGFVRFWPALSGVTGAAVFRAAALVFRAGFSSSRIVTDARPR